MRQTRTPKPGYPGVRSQVEATTKGTDMPGKDELPSTLERSSKKAQRTWVKAHDSAVETYGEGERAHRTAFSALKHSFEKVGDHWEEKEEKGPSDPQARKRGRAARERPTETFGGVDIEGNTKQELYERARELGVEGRSRMDKRDLARAIARKQK
jgi:cation transport regulator ChaB